jgi:hypothetical protein
MAKGLEKRMDHASQDFANTFGNDFVRANEQAVGE